MAPKTSKKDTIPAPVEAPTEAIEVSDADDSPTALATVADEWDFGEDAGTGFKNLSKDEFSIPFYALLQSNSDIVKENRIEGARGGDYVNLMTNELFKKLIIQPVHIDRVIVEWFPRGSAKGKVAARHQFASPEVQEAIARNGGSIISTKEKPLLINGENNLVDTRYCYFNRLAEDGLTVIGFGVFSFTKTKIKKINDATSAIAQSGTRAPLWSGRFVLGTQVEKKGPDTWHNVTITAFGKNNLLFDKSNLLPPSHPLYAEGKSLQRSIVSGVHKADFEAEEKLGGEGDGESIDSPGAGKRHF